MHVGSEVFIWSNVYGAYGKIGLVIEMEPGLAKVEHLQGNDMGNRHWYTTINLEEIGDEFEADEPEVITTPCVKAKLPWKTT